MKEPMSQANIHFFSALSVTVLVFPGEISFCKGQKPFVLTQKFMASLPCQSPPRYGGGRMVNTQPSVNVSQ